MEATDRTRKVRFEAFEVNLHSGEVRKHGIRLKLHGQPFQVLSLLLEHPGGRRYARGASPRTLAWRHFCGLR